MWNSARKRKENEYSRARHGPLSPRWKTARDIKKRKSRGGGTCCVVGRAPFTVQRGRELITWTWCARARACRLGRRMHVIITKRN